MTAVSMDRIERKISAAQKRVERIRAGMHSFIATRKEIAAAYADRDWVTLGYASFEEYVEHEFSETRLRLTPEERREAVAELRLTGMSQRGISAALGVSQSTVRDDIAELSTSTQFPDQVTSADGKARPATRPTSAQTPEPVAATSTAPAGSGSNSAPDGPPPSPGADPAPAANPAPRQEPDLTPSILASLTEAGPQGRTAAQIGWPDNSNVDALKAALHKLAADGVVVVVGHKPEGAPFWALTELVDAAPSAEPTPPPSRFALTAEQRQQIADEAERVRSIDNARRKADRLVREVSGLITEIEAGVLLGEPDLITADMIAGIRAEADRLERILKERA